MFSLYYSLFNVVKNNFPWQESLEQGVSFAGPDGEVVIAVNQSEDDTLKVIRDWATSHSTVKVVSTSYAYTDVEFDGKTKDAALQACTKEIMIQMDADEVIPLWQKPRWERYARQLLNSNFDCYMVPSVDLYGARDTIRRDHNTGTKFRMHKPGFKRGVWRKAWLIPGKQFDTSKSDSCELLTTQGDLVRCVGIVPDFALQPSFASILDDYIYTVHSGYLSFEHRVNVNKAIWADHWSLRAGREANVTIDVDKLTKEPIMKHNLRIE